MYGQLPSYVLANGTTFDLLVADALAEYEQKLANPGYTSNTHNLSQEEMMNMINSVRNKNV